MNGSSRDADDSLTAVYHNAGTSPSLLCGAARSADQLTSLLRTSPDGAEPFAAHHSSVARTFIYLGRNRWAGIGLAIVVETALLLPMAFAKPSDVVGIPAAISAAIAGTVAVVFGPLDGALVAVVGAALFGSASGWGAGEVAALIVWPAVVVAAGLFARRVERQRRVLAQLVATQEDERQRIALELHDRTAQDLTAALLALGRVESAAKGDSGAAAQTIRTLIQETIGNVRELAVELRPKALDDFGLEPAVERMAADFARRSGEPADVDVRLGPDRLPPEIELVAFRVVQEVLADIEAGDDESGEVRIVIDRDAREVRVRLEWETNGRPLDMRLRASTLDGLRERARLLGGRLSATSRDGIATVGAAIPLGHRSPGERRSRARLPT